MAVPFIRFDPAAVEIELTTVVALKYSFAVGLVIVTAALIAVVLAYFELWDPILDFLGGLRIHLNFAAYFWFSTLLFLVWAVTFFVICRRTAST